MKSLKEEMQGFTVTGKPKTDLSGRLLEFAAMVIKATYDVPKSTAGSHITHQLIKSVTSAGANYEEACTAESRADFIHKATISLKELRETNYWLKLASKLDLFNKGSDSPFLQESDELLRIIAKSVVTAKGNHSSRGMEP